MTHSVLTKLRANPSSPPHDRLFSKEKFIFVVLVDHNHRHKLFTASTTTTKTFTMKFITAISLIGAASAFAPAQQQRTQTSLNLWGEPTQKDGEQGEMSKALPFAPRPKLLDGTLAGDVGFDPFSFAGADKQSLFYMREAEVKHCRLAMLAVVGWPLAELWDKPIADAAGLPSLLTKTGESPSLLNGGLDKIDAVYWIAVIALAGIVELENADAKEAKPKDYLPGDCNFDPLNLFGETKEDKMKMMTKEIKHGRIAMMAILGFAIQEAIYGIPVVQETPFFFTPAL